MDCIERIKAKDAIPKCILCEKNISAGIKYKKDVLKDKLSGEIIGVAFD